MFQITQPQPFTEALDSRAVKTILPTSLRTQAMSALPAEIRERAFWSAGVTNAEFLQKASDIIDQIIQGKIDRAAGRQMLDGLRESLGAPPVSAVGKGGGLTDLWSEARQNVLLDTNVQMARGYGQWMQGMDADILDEFPAQELLRVAPRDKVRDWPQRWQDAGGRFFGGAADYPEGRMIALKTDPIWSRISRFGLPYPPYDFNSGMGVEDVDREEAEKIGLIKPSTVLHPQSRGFNDDLQLSPAVRASSLLNVLISAFKASGLTFKDGVFTTN